MDELAVQALAMGRECAFLPGEAASRDLVALAVFPLQSPFFHPTLLVIVLRVVGTSLPIQLALETAFLVLVSFEFATCSSDTTDAVGCLDPLRP